MSFNKPNLRIAKTRRSFQTNFKLGTFLLLGLLLLSSLLAACGDSQTAPPFTVGSIPTIAPTFTPVPPPAQGSIGSDSLGITQVKATLNGGGSSFAAPIYNFWRDPANPNSFKKTSPNVTIEYATSSSGAGRQGLLANTLDFAGSDSPFNAAEISQAISRGQVVHIPMAVGAVVAIYNLKSVQHLKLSGPVLADIFTGKIQKWDDAAIKNDNPDATLPSQPIYVVIRNRSSASGTTDIFTRYLSVVSDSFRSQFGDQNLGKFTLAAQGALEGSNNDDVAAKVNQTDGSIGYVDQSAVNAPDYQRPAGTAAPTGAQAAKPTIAYAQIRNTTGRFIYPTRDTVSAAATGSFIPDDFRTFIVNGEGQNTYPIVGFTWIITWRDLSLLPNPSKDKATALTSFLWWGIHQGQTSLPEGYAPLPSSLIPRLERLFVTESRNNPVDKVLLYQQQPLLSQP